MSNDMYIGNVKCNDCKYKKTCHPLTNAYNCENYEFEDKDGKIPSKLITAAPERRYKMDNKIEVELLKIVRLIETNTKHISELLEITQKIIDTQKILLEEKEE